MSVPGISRRTPWYRRERGPYRVLVHAVGRDREEARLLQVDVSLRSEGVERLEPGHAEVGKAEEGVHGVLDAN
eukprot:944303-Rhodomonas_salina.1